MHLATNSTRRKDWKKAILQHPQACNQHLQDQTDTCNAIWDSRAASVCVSNDKNNFVGSIKKTQNSKVNRISRAMGVTRLAKDRWSLVDTAEEVHHIELQCCCAPSATQQPSSTSVFCKACPRNAMAPNPKSWTVQPEPNKLNKNAIDININPVNNLLTTRCICIDSLNDSAVHFSENLAVTHTSNHNLDKPQKEPLRWRCNWDIKICKTFRNCCNQAHQLQLMQCNVHTNRWPTFDTTVFPSAHCACLENRQSRKTRQANQCH